MKPLKNAASFTILTSFENLRQQLLTIEKAGRTCYQSEKGLVTEKTAADFARRMLVSGHHSVIEHSSLTVRFENLSRGFTHEMVRHRLCAFSQESTRYVDYAKRGEGDVDLDRFQMNFVPPPHRDENEKMELENGKTMTPVEMAEHIEMFYRALRKAGWAPQDARQFLPIGLKAEIIVSANFREWRHIFKMRTGKPAHWEIRKVMGDLLVALQEQIPVVFDDFYEAGVDGHGLRYFEQDIKVLKEKHKKQR